MTSSRIEVKPSLAEVKRKTAAAHKRLSNTGMPLAHKKISIFLDSWVQRNFKAEGALVGGWKSLSSFTRAGTNPVILQDTGRLKASFFPFASKSDAGVASQLPYSKPHEKGMGVPKRRILPSIKEVKKDVTKIYTNQVNGAMKRMT